MREITEAEKEEIFEVVVESFNGSACGCLETLRQLKSRGFKIVKEKDDE